MIILSLPDMDYGIVLRFQMSLRMTKYVVFGICFVFDLKIYGYYFNAAVMLFLTVLIMVYRIQCHLCTVKPVLRGHIWDKEKVAL